MTKHYNPPFSPGSLHILLLVDVSLFFQSSFGLGQAEENVCILILLFYLEQTFHLVILPPWEWESICGGKGVAWERMQGQEMKMSGSEAVGTRARNIWDFHCQMERVEKQLFVVQQITGSPKLWRS